MRRLIFVCSLLASFAVHCAAQGGATAVAVTQRNLSVSAGEARLKYEASLKAWSDNDKRLESELLSGDPDLPQRIQKARDLRNAVMANKKDYFEKASQLFESYRGLFSPSATSHVDPAQMKKEADAVNNDLGIQKDRLRDEIDHLGNDTKSVILKAALEQEKNALDQMRDSLDRQSRELADAADSNKKIEENRTNMTARLDSVVQGLKDQESANDESSKAWNRYYQRMQEAITRVSAPKPPVASPAPDVPAPKPAPIRQESHPDGACTPSPSLFDGVWELPAASEGDVVLGVDRPALLYLNLQVRGNEVDGTLTYASGAEPVILNLTKGPAEANGRVDLNWTIKGDSTEGILELQLPCKGTFDDGSKMTLAIKKSSNPKIPEKAMFFLVGRKK